MTRSELIAFANKKYDQISIKSWPKRIYYCQAWYVEDDDYAVLKSYNTVVAIQNKKTGTVFVFDYYSSTTSQHIAKFIRMVDAFRVTYLYRRSDRVCEIDLFCETPKAWKLSAKDFARLADCDYSLAIGNAWH